MELVSHVRIQLKDDADRGSKLFRTVQTSEMIED